MRWVREWPRLVGVVVVLAVALVLIGVVVAAAARSGGGGGPGSSAAPVRAPKVDNAALVKRQDKAINYLRATVATQQGQIATLRQQLRRERELRRIHAKVTHQRKQHSNRR